VDVRTMHVFDPATGRNITLESGGTPVDAAPTALPDSPG
jgi:hypothetical protein